MSDHIQLYLDIGNKHPFDADEETPAKDVDDWAKRAARGVVANLRDRRGIKYGFNNIDIDVRTELIDTLAKIIRMAHDQPS